MGGETSEAWRVVLDDLVKRGLVKPRFLIVDGGTGLEQALAALWGDVPTQRCTVHKHRNLLAHAPQWLHGALWSRALIEETLCPVHRNIPDLVRIVLAIDPAASTG